MPPTTIVFASRPGDRLRAGRTLRALQRAGLDPVDATRAPDATPASLAAHLTGGPVWLVRAGAWPAGAGPIAFPPPSATRLPLVALGAVREGDDADVRHWKDLLARTGGDLARLDAPPPLASVYCEPAPALALSAALHDGRPLADALASVLDAALHGGAARLVRYAPLDVHDDASLRVVLAVTSLQQGGAERVVLDLFHELGALGVRPLLVVIGRPTRAAFPAPPGTVDVSRAGPRREDRIAALAHAAEAHAADLVHAHLLNGDDVAMLAARGLPLAVTVHNTREGWPEGLANLRAGEVALLAACSLAAEADLLAAALPAPVRTVWNGIDTARLRASPARLREGAALRARLRFAPRDLVLLAVANPRPQKRLHLLPEVLAEARAELARRGIAREARLLLVGDAEPRTEAAAASARALRDAVARLGLASHVTFLGSLDDPAPALAAADVLVSASAHEGLSLAHLEALAAGLPVAATDAGGTREIVAAAGDALALLPCDAPPAHLAAAAVRLALDALDARRADRRPDDALDADFSRRRMAARYASLYPRAVQAARPAPASRAPRGLVLVTNNLSTGGAQSSARRLLLALAAEGIPVRAAVLEEQPAFPTPGRRALEAAGVPVLALPPSDAPDAVARLLDDLDAAPPRAVLFWNAIAEHKILLADALLDVPIFDVSPGEMYYASLDRHLRHPRPALPYRDARAYGARLAGVIVKYAAEAPRAAEALGAPVHVIPNGVPLPDRPTPRAPGDRLVLGTTARISPQKKLEALFAALRHARPHLPPHVLRIAGSPERGAEAYADALRREAEGLDVEWVGEVAEAGPFLASLDVFVMISEPAGCPNASLEAMAAGLPVVATDVGGAAEQVEDGVTGRIVPRDDSAALAAALVEVGGDPARRARFGAAGRARAEARFDVRRMAADYRRVCL